MAVREILRLGHPVLRQRAQPVPDSAFGSDWLTRLIEDLTDTMHAANGLGIAAPQIGEPWRVAVLEVPADNPRYPGAPAYPFGVYVNPELEIIDATAQGFWEGCLSVPGLRGQVKRPRAVRVRWRDPAGEPHELVAEDFPATVFQHEFDHLDGILYVDRVTDTRTLSFLEEFARYHAPAAPAGQARE
ncbi:MAG: peptide deformylase [Burkholderiaceae bacterium]